MKVEHWDLSGMNYEYFTTSGGGTEIDLLDAIGDWLRETNLAVGHIHITQETMDGDYFFPTATVETCGIVNDGHYGSKDDGFVDVDMEKLSADFIGVLEKHGILEEDND